MQSSDPRAKAEQPADATEAELLETVRRKSLRKYDEFHEEFERQQPQPVLDRKWHILALRELGDVRGLKVLEIGCGRGEFARRLAELGAEVTAADFSPVAIEYTRKRLEGYAGATAVVADIERIPFVEETFDLTVSLETLEHVHDPNRALRELVRVTRRGGRLVITTPNYLNMYGLYRAYLRLTGRRYREAGEQPINNLTFLFLRVRALKRLGCRVDTVDGIGQYIGFPGLGAVEVRALEHPHAVMKWLALESLTAATRL